MLVPELTEGNAVNVRYPESTLVTIVIYGKGTIALFAEIPVRASLRAFFNGPLAAAGRALMVVFFLAYCLRISTNLIV